MAALGDRYVTFEATRSTFPKVWEVEGIAVSLAAGHGYAVELDGVVNRAFNRPLYPFLAAGVYLLFGHSHTALQLAQVALSAATAALVVYLGALAYGLRQGLVAGALVALHPGLVFFSVAQLHYLTLDALLLVLLWLAFYRLWRHPGWRGEALCGLALGVAVLSIPSAMAFVPAGMLLLWACGEIGWRRFLRANVVVAAVAFLVVLPWNVRNYLVLGHLVFISSSAAQTFWIGNNPNATGTTLTLQGIGMDQAAPPGFQAELARRDEFGRSEFYRQQALAYVASEPGAFVERTARKFLYFLWFPPTVGTIYPSHWADGYRLYYVGVLVLLGLGLLSLRRAPRPTRLATALLLTMPLSVGLFHSFFYVDGRLRWQAEAFLLLVAAQGLVAAWDALRSCHLWRGRLSHPSDH